MTRCDDSHRLTGQESPAATHAPHKRGCPFGVRWLDSAFGSSRAVRPYRSNESGVKPPHSKGPKPLPTARREEMTPQPCQRRTSAQLMDCVPRIRAPNTRPEQLSCKESRR